MTVEGVPLVARTLGLTVTRLTNMRPVFDDIATDFMAGEDALFGFQGAAGEHGKWAPVDPTYAAAKKAAGFGSKILVRTGDLRKSLTKRGGDNIRRIGRQRMEVGTRVKYAKFHQRGTRRMPAREPIRVTDNQKRFWVRLIQKFLIVTGQFRRRNL